MKRLVGIFTILFLIFSLTIAVYFVHQQTQLSPRASSTGTTSLENSYVFASPLITKAGGEGKITVSVFVLSDQGLGVEGKTITLYSVGRLSPSTSLDTNILRGITDNRGMAVFEVTSRIPGPFDVWAQVEGEGKINQVVLITFE